jgi:primosomal protein N' (replication factor Y)
MTSEQRRLFDDPEPTPWEDDDQSEHLAATVVFVAGPPGEFDYLVPDELAERLEAGCRVRVPLGRGNRLAQGYCVGLEVKPLAGRRLKSLAEVVDRRSLLSRHMLYLTRWIADHYLCPWGQVLEAVVPAGVRTKAGTRLTTLLSLSSEGTARLNDSSVPPTQSKVLQVLAAAEQPLTPAELGRAARCSTAPITALRRKGWIDSRTTRLQRALDSEPVARHDPKLELNPAQRRALEVISRAVHTRAHRTLLVHGVTGSGKTELYIRAIQEVIGFGRQAIVLVPEISLTPQTVRRFRARFDSVAVLHSHLSDAERHWHWQEIASGRVQVVVGARSAIFAPVPHLGLVVLDEEHESSFKQDSTPRYHARDVAIARTEAEKVPLVLGSATPSLESWHRARSGEYELLELPHRVLDRPMPSVGVVDLRQHGQRTAYRGAVSRQLHQAMNESLRMGGQVILLLNRRGFSTHIQCPACGHVMKCPDCEIALTHHRAQEIALCHYCDYQEPTPTTCPNCNSGRIRYSGLGTQRLEAEIRRRFPGVPCLRMDTDTMRGRGSHERALEAFRAGEVRILLGTQMIAKGLDFPNVTLVGVINADTALHLPDFRAAERTFQLVAQVAGRTGRGEKGGRVLVQTCNPEHPAIRAAARHDYAAFAAEELPMRELLRYPPFSTMVRMIVRSQKEPDAQAFAQQLAEWLGEQTAGASLEARILGPAPAPFARLRGYFRFQLQVQGTDGPGLRALVSRGLKELRAPESVQWIADVDPLDML